MFTAALFTTAKTSYMCTHTHTHEYYSAIKKNEILPFATTWMDSEGITLSAMSDTERQILYDTCLSRSSLLQLVGQFLGPSMLLKMTLFHPFYS